MRMLEQDGLLVREPRRGVRVAPLSAEDAEEVYTCRVPIETLAAGLAARHAKSSDIAEMRRLHKLCASRFAEGDVRGHFRANAQMSDVLYRSARNQTLLRLEQVIKKQALRYRFLVYCRSETFRWDSVRSNAALIDAIANKDSTAAERLVHNLITSSLPAIKTCLVE
jgi:DNA-binding GntR family transcriptional regulator